jgi:hypothetical protein
MRSTIECCKLVDSFTGRMIVPLTREEANSMVGQGAARRRRSHTYSFVAPIHPSSSSETAPSLMVHDTMVVASGSAPTIEDFERLFGWGFRVEKPRLTPQLV